MLNLYTIKLFTETTIHNKTLLFHQITTNRSNLIAYIFYQKLQKLLKDLYDKH